MFNPQGVECLLEDSRLDIYPIHIYAKDKTRLIRSLEREEEPDCYEICRRFQTDAADFCDIDFDYQVIFNEGDFEHTCADVRNILDKIN